MIESFVNPAVVAFDPANEEHLAAAAMLLFYNRQHPTLRFHYDVSKYQSVYEHVLYETIRHLLPNGAAIRAFALAQMLQSQAVYRSEVVEKYAEDGKEKRKEVWLPLPADAAKLEILKECSRPYSPVANSRGLHDKSPPSVVRIAG